MHPHDCKIQLLEILSTLLDRLLHLTFRITDPGAQTFQLKHLFENLHTLLTEELLARLA